MNAARLLAACLALLMAMAGLLPTHAVAQDDEDTRLAEADTAVIAQGVAALPEQAVWTVARPTAEAGDEASPAALELGFALATDEPIVVSDETTGARLRLSEGEGAYNAAGTSQVVASVGDGATDYTRISLTSADVTRDAPDGGPTYAGEAFAAPKGDRDIDLVTAVLDGETSWTLATDRAPALIYAPDGLRYAVGRAAPQELAAGEAVAAEGRLTLFAPEVGEDAEPVRAYAAVIGAELPAVEQTTPGGEATLSLELLQCPPDGLAIPGGGETPAPCDPDGVLVPVPGVVITFENVGSGATFTLTTGEGGRLVESIAAGDYRILSFDDVQASTRAVIATCTLTDPLESRPDVILATLPLRGGEAVECALYADGGTFDVAAVPAEGGTVAFGLLACPPGFADFPDDTPPSPDGLVSCDGDLDLSEATPFAGAEIVLTAEDGTTRSGVTSEFEPVIFAGVEAGTYVADVLVADSPLSFRSYCTLVSASGDLPVGVGSIGPGEPLAVGDGETLQCSLLVRRPIDVGGRSSLDVVVVECPDGTNAPRIPTETVYDCGGAPAPAGLVVELTSADSGDTVTAETDSDGTATFPSELGGSYSLGFPGIQGGAYGVCTGSGGPVGTIPTVSLPAGDIVTCFAFVLDADDFAAFTDPADADGDYLSDSQEARLGTDPGVVDTDGDGTDDASEVVEGTDPFA